MFKNIDWMKLVIEVIKLLLAAGVGASGMAVCGS
jgi:hypothetical protein